MDDFINTFQAPNYIVDEYLPLLTGTEFKILMFIARCLSTFDNNNPITPADIVRGTGLTLESVLQSVDDLMNFKFIAQTDLISLDFLDGSDIDKDALKERE